MSIHHGLLCPVDDALATNIVDATLGDGWSRANTERQLRAFVATAAAGVAPAGVTYTVASDLCLRLRHAQECRGGTVSISPFLA